MATQGPVRYLFAVEIVWQDEGWNHGGERAGITTETAVPHCFATNRTYRRGIRGDFDRVWHAIETRPRIALIHWHSFGSRFAAKVAPRPIEKTIH